VFFTIHDPRLNRQGADAARTSLGDTTMPSRRRSEEKIAQLDAEHCDDPIVTEVTPLDRSNRRDSSPRLLQSQSEPGILPGGDRPEGREGALEVL
jgi:hypothetical protein